MKEGSILGSCVIGERLINIADAHEDSRFDVSFDKKTGYRTRSMLSVPIIDQRSGNIKGCLQVGPADGDEHAACHCLSLTVTDRHHPIFPRHKPRLYYPRPPAPLPFTMP